MDSATAAEIAEPLSPVHPVEPGFVAECLENDAVAVRPLLEINGRFEAPRPIPGGDTSARRALEANISEDDRLARRLIEEGNLAGHALRVAGGSCGVSLSGKKAFMPMYSRVSQNSRCSYSPRQLAA